MLCYIPLKLLLFICSANWDGFYDNETDIWGYTWAAGSTTCGTEVQTWDDPHDHLAGKSYWTYQVNKTRK